MANQKYQFIQGTIINPLSDKKSEFYPDGVIEINAQGRIKKIQHWSKLSEKTKKMMTAKNTLDLSGKLVLPGFFDMHFHWVQDDVREMPKESLLDWLEDYTFPTEAKFKNKSYAKKKADSFFKKLVQHGTLGGACYSSLHEHALEFAMKNVKGDFVIGNVLMNMNSPKNLTQTEDESLNLTKRFLKKYKTRFCFTPRFAITTTPKVMKEGAKLTDKAKAFKQTHLSETPGEIDFVLSLYKKIPGFQKVKSYTEIYEKSGMLGKNSLMGHGIYLSKKELQTIAHTKTHIIHCPTSNAPLEEKGLGSGLFDLKAIQKKKISWALGSDIGGGPFLSMFDVMRSFVDQHTKKKVKVSYTQALYRSTLAGAEILGVAKSTGNFAPKKDLNFFTVQIPSVSRLESAEMVLKEVTLSCAHKREAYEKLVKDVFYQGKKLI